MKYFLADQRCVDNVENGVVIGRKSSVNLAFKPYPYYIIDQSPMSQKGQAIIQCWETYPEESETVKEITKEEAQELCNEWFKVKENTQDLEIIVGEDVNGLVVHRPQNIDSFDCKLIKNEVAILRSSING